MPGGDRTGPSGFGARTGRGLGYCSGSDNPGFAYGPGRRIVRNSVYERARILNHADNYVIPAGRGMARGRRGNWRTERGGYLGGGRGGVFYRAPIYPTPTEITPEQRLSMLKQDKEFLESELDSLQNSIETVSKKIEDLEKTD